jgi:hypothetical protein
MGDSIRSAIIDLVEGSGDRCGEKPNKSFLYVFLTKLPSSGLGVVLLVDCRQLTKDVATHSSRSSDSLFMAAYFTRVEQAWRPANSTGKTGSESEMPGKQAHWL